MLPKLQRVDEMLEPPFVGRFYLVPGATHIFLYRAGWYPVIGAKHEDAEHIKFPHQHYHPDWRFMPEWSWEQSTDIGVQRAFGSPLCHRPIPWSDMNEVAPFGPLTYRRRKCKRIPPVNTIFAEQKNGRALHDAWLGKDAHRGPFGLICPHRGTALGTMPINEDGTVTCPLHGLKFCARTGKSVPTNAS